MHRRRLRLLPFLCLPLILAACMAGFGPTREPLAATLPPMAGDPTFQPPSGWVEPTRPAPSPTPEWFTDLYSITDPFPNGTGIINDQCWKVASDHEWWSILAVPYMRADGFHFALVGQPRTEENGPWDAYKHQILWDWTDLGIDPPGWENVIRAPVDGAFLAEDKAQNWHLVYWDLPSQKVRAILPVANPEDFSIQFAFGGVFVRDGNRLVFYDLVESQAQERWSITPVLGKDFQVADPSGANSPWQADLNGDGSGDLMIYWETEQGTTVQILTKNDGVVQSAGELPPDGQMVNTQNGRFGPDLPPAYLVPDEIGKLMRWQVYHWVEDHFEASGYVASPHASPAIVLGPIDPLPPLPADLYFRQGDSNSWYRVPKTGGFPVPVKPLYSDPQSCRSDQGFSNCTSPDGLYRLVQTHSQMEDGFVAVEDVQLGQQTVIKDTFFYTTGINSFSWSGDSSVILLAQGPFGADVDRVNPTNAERTPIIHFSAFGFDRMRFEGTLAATDPLYLPDGRPAFTVQSSSPRLFPPPGVYRLDGQGRLDMLAAIPHLNLACGSSDLSDFIFGATNWSPDRTAFVYRGSTTEAGDSCTAMAVILRVGATVYDLSAKLPDVREFRWQ